MAFFRDWSRPWEHWYRRALPAYWVSLALATHFPRLRIDSPALPNDRVLHLLAFAVLTLLLWKFFESFRRPPTGVLVWLCGVVLLAYAALDEYTQQFFGRGVDFYDWVFDAGGVVATLAVLEGLRRRRTGRSAPRAA